MSLLLLSASNDNVPLEQLDSLEQCAQELSQALREDPVIQIAGITTLATCNRLELYVDMEQADTDLALSQAGNIISAVTGLSETAYSEYFRKRTDLEVVRHLFRVTAGLDSMVIGEEEIAGQVKRAFLEAQNENKLTPDLHRVFERALSTAKAVTTTTGLGAAGRSTMTVALDYVVENYSGAQQRPVLIIGTGAHARVVVAALQRLQFSKISVYSHSGRAEEFASDRGISFVTTSDLTNAIHASELIIGCSGNQRNAISAQTLSTHPARPLIVIDVALTPDIEPSARELEHVELIDLEFIRAHTPAAHEDSVLAAEAIVSDAVEQWQREQRERTLDPFVTAVRRKLYLWIDEEVARVRLREGDDAAREAEQTLSKIANEMLHEPITQAKKLASSGDEEKYRQAMLVLFGGSHE